MTHEPVTNTEVIQAVADAVEVVQSKDLEALGAVWRNLTSLPRDTVIKELMRLVEDYAYKADDLQIEFTSLTLPDNSHGIIDASIKHDVIALKAALGSSKLSDLFASLLLIIAALKDATAVSDMGTR